MKPRLETLDHTSRRTRRDRGAARVADWWSRLWFEPATAGNLGFCRLLFFALLFWFYRGIDHTIWGDLPASFQNANPIRLFELLNVGSPTIKGLAISQFVFKTALLFACVGLFTRTSCLIALIAGTYVLGMPHTFGKTGHGDGILLLAMLVLALSRCGDAWSIDAMVRTWRRGPPFERVASGEYTWPVRCIWILSAVIFFSAGLAKIRMNPTWHSWFTTDTLSHILLQHRIKSSPLVDWGVWIAAHPVVCKPLAAAIVFVEVLFPVAIVSRIARRTLVPVMFLSQIGIALTMGVPFTQFMFIYLFWIPWDRIGRAAQWLGAQGLQRRAVFFDGGCGFCRKAVAVLWHLDLLRRLELYDVVHDWDVVSSRYPRLDRTATLDDMHAVTGDGRIYRGYDAYRSIAWVLPATWVLLPILYLPPVRWIGWKVYRYIATHRHDAGCELAPRGMEVVISSSRQSKAHGRDAHATIESAP